MAENHSDNDKTQTHIALTEGTMVSHYRIVEKIGNRLSSTALIVTLSHGLLTLDQLQFMAATSWSRQLSAQQSYKEIQRLVISRGCKFEVKGKKL